MASLEIEYVTVSTLGFKVGVEVVVVVVVVSVAWLILFFFFFFIQGFCQHLLMGCLNDCLKVGTVKGHCPYCGDWAVTLCPFWGRDPGTSGIELLVIAFKR